MEFLMFQSIVETTNVNGLNVHTLENGNLIAGFKLELIDEELKEQSEIESLLVSILKDLPLNRTLRFYLKADYEDDFQFKHSRSDALKKIGFIKYSAFVVFEKPVSSSLSIFRKTKSSEDQGIITDFGAYRDAGFKVTPMVATEFDSILPKIPNEVNHSFQTIDLGGEVLSIMRLVNQSEFGMDHKTLSEIKDTLPLPYVLCCTVEAVSQGLSETMLRRRSKQNSFAEDIKEARKYSEAQDDLEDVSLNGRKLFKFEWQCLLTRKSEIVLREDREEVKRKLEVLGNIYIESVGALESLKGIYPGEHPHYSLFEKDDVLTTYIPLISRGESKIIDKISPCSMAIHRKDESISFVDFFDANYESFSWCIFGRPGTGKSVLTNAITRSLVFDPNVKIIKIDVGGSHSRETQALGGKEVTLSLNEPTGLNPFDVIRELGPTREAIQILSSFLEVLILEEGESKLPKTMKSEIERSLNSFSEKNPENLTLENFFKITDSIPRKDLLQRWVGNGVYGNAFSITGNSIRAVDLEAQLTYYNFSKISQALDPDYAQGGLAAVMARFNLEMLKKAQHKKRIVFIADETPFFIRKCFSFFNLSIANVRKEGHGFITIAQKSSHVVVDGDTGILDNSPNKIFFSLDGDEQSFMGRTQLDPEAVDKIRGLQRKQGHYSEALLKDQYGERIIRVRLSPQEYWSYTSKDEDKRKIEQIKSACPDLKIEEVIKCLAL